MKVLITGGDGFVGRYVQAVLMRKGIDYVTVSRKASGVSSENIQMDLLKEEKIAQIIKDIKPTHLIHLAWYTEHGEFWSSDINLEWLKATYRLVEAFCRNGGQYAFISGTCAEYDIQHGYCIENLTTLNPQTIYGIAKDTTRRLSEQVCNNFGVPLTWGRIFYPYGTGESNKRLIPALFNVFNKNIPPFGVSSESFRDLMHARDLSEGIVLALERKYNGVINLSSGDPLSLGKIVSAVAHICDSDPMIVLRLASERFGEPRLLVGDNSILRSLGWVQNISIQEGLCGY